MGMKKHKRTKHPKWTLSSPSTGLHLGDGGQDPRPRPHLRRQPLPQGPLVPVRRHHALLHRHLHPVANPGDAPPRAQVHAVLHLAGAEAADHDPVHPDLPAVLDAEGEDQPDLQAVEPPDLQRHHLLPLLHESLRIAGYGIYAHKNVN